MQRLDVPVADRAYPVFVGRDLLSDAANWAPWLPQGAQLVVVTNETVGPLYGEALSQGLGDARTHTITLPDGEAHKTLENWQGVLDVLVKLRAGRDCCLVALGGGVVGDLCGFAAASYMRGVRFIQVPTTLLAQVDSSVGGKTGVNHERGKNLVGAFHQPAAVMADTGTLATLPEREYQAGLAEVVKYGAIRDSGFLDELDRDRDALVARDDDAITRSVLQSVKHKAEVVAADEYEAGQRALLNFGHTFGHALETLTGYTSLLHGEAVSIGMVTAARLSEQRGLCPPGAAERLSGLLSALGLPVQVPNDIDTEDMLHCMKLDKKNLAGRQRLVLLTALGHAVVDEGSTATDLARAIDACR